jgi:hypothetical protein
MLNIDDDLLEGFATVEHTDFTVLLQLENRRALTQAKLRHHVRVTAQR